MQCGLARTTETKAASKIAARANVWAAREKSKTPRHGELHVAAAREKTKSEFFEIPPLDTNRRVGSMIAAHNHEHISDLSKLTLWSWEIFSFSVRVLSSFPYPKEHINTAISSRVFLCALFSSHFTSSQILICLSIQHSSFGYREPVSSSSTIPLHTRDSLIFSSLGLCLHLLLLSLVFFAFSSFVV